MLVLTRKPLETIKIGNDIVLKVICTGTRSVRIGIEAPEHVRILRGELAEFSPLESAAAELEQPLVADAATDCEPSMPSVVVGPMTAEKFLAEFEDDLLPGLSIRRMLAAMKPALTTAAK